ncbi:aromatic acid exporter family protein [Clostridium rectalis]|uniref:aromatic acid exporter family protein n=1 Tax=Clostridium rectalis TaxID=2040295 RepID=UPI000F63EC85|nr:aromatic acid exporter family protein [Clostridium rectalis]
MKLIGYRTLKTGIGASLAIIIAKQIGLQYAVSAGIIAILSVQSTKKQSVKIAIKRVISCIVALILACVLFKILGFNEVAFGIFLIIFIPLTVKLNVEEGIVVSSVLVSHLLSEKSVNIVWILNELGLMVVGVSIALVLNLYMTSIEEQIKEDQIYIEDTMKRVLIKMSEEMKNQKSLIEKDDLINKLDRKLIKGKKRAYTNFNNYFEDSKYYVEYMEMRIQQFDTIKRMQEHFKYFFITYDQTIMIANFTEKVAKHLYEKNTAEKLIEDLYMLKETFRKMPLPVTREEFENRALLFQFLNDMEQFLKIKKKFRQNYYIE